MPNSWNDQSNLKTLANYRLLSLDQLSEVSGASIQSVRRHTARWEKLGLVRRWASRIENLSGRPKLFVALTEKGLREIPKAKQFSKTRAPLETHHQLINQVRIAFHSLASQELSVSSIASNSMITTDHAPRFHSIPNEPDSAFKNKFVPDAVFSLQSLSSQKRLLFFLEADCGTEPLRSSKPNGSDLLGKIQNYRTYFGLGLYSEYSQWMGINPKGFRLLFVCQTSTRRRQISSLVVSSPPSDFVWITDSERISDSGIRGKIWARGGNEEIAPDSILGRLATKNA